MKCYVYSVASGWCDDDHLIGVTSSLSVVFSSSDESTLVGIMSGSPVVMWGTWVTNVGGTDH
jgi:hypothetical protein